MAGPTPVSALIHAATMVTSGIYLITRLNPIMAQAGWANDVIAWVGALTALVAATAAVAQNDIKKVLAYSTVSQLGYMFLAVGTQTYVAGVFHMVTHAFFKALLFLGAGAVIHSMAHEQDMRRYGGLRKHLPITFATFFIGWLAIAGVPPLAGFWSKDEILAGTFNTGGSGLVLWAIGLVVAALTAFYMTRQLIMTFFGPEQWRVAEETHDEADDHGADHADDHDHHHLTPDHQPHESPWTMLAPLVVLSGLAIVGGAMNLPFGKSFHRLEHWLHPVIVEENPLPKNGWTLLGLAATAVAMAAIGIAVAHAVYLRRKVDPAKIELPVLAHAWYIDESYAKVAGGPGTTAFQAVADADGKVVDGVVNGVGAGAVGLGSRLRTLQNGLIRSYALGVGVGAVLLLGYIVTRMNL
jgi:NADH-quinone oxidoreductase subunit L